MMFKPQTKCTTQHGFSLIELIGVLAIMSILASVIVPNLVKRIDSANADAEMLNLTHIASELERYITTQFTIPSSLDWAQAVASVSSLPINKVSQNKQGFNRGFYVDPKFFTNFDKVFAGYTQGAGKVFPPISPRIMLVSDMKGPAPAAPSSSAAFEAIWNQSVNSSIIENESIKIHRINLNRIFHQVLLSNGSTDDPFYRLNSANEKVIPTAVNNIKGELLLYVIDGSLLSLHLPPYPTGSAQFNTLIQSSVNISYDTNGASWFWSRL